MIQILIQPEVLTQVKGSPALGYSMRIPKLGFIMGRVRPGRSRSRRPGGLCWMGKLLQVVVVVAHGLAASGAQRGVVGRGLEHRRVHLTADPLPRLTWPTKNDSRNVFIRVGVCMCVRVLFLIKKTNKIKTNTELNQNYLWTTSRLDRDDWLIPA